MANTQHHSLLSSLDCDIYSTHTHSQTNERETVREMCAVCVCQMKWHFSQWFIGAVRTSNSLIYEYGEENFSLLKNT